ncbi:MAG: STAUR_1299 family protein [Cystobacter sp.]
MDADTTELIHLAFDRAPASLANVAIQRAREQALGDGSLATSYELLLPDGNVRAWLLNTQLPRLVDYLESRGSRLPRCGGVFLSVFVGDTLHFIHARDALALFSRWSGLSFDVMRERYGPR